MDELIWSDQENSTEDWEDDAQLIFNSTVATSTSGKNAAKQSVPTKVVVAVSMVIMILGVVTNSGVLAVLVRARRQFGSSVHTLITNQCSIDLYTSVFGMCTLVLMVTHGYRYNGNPIVDGAICVLFEAVALTVLGVTASSLGLIVITLERYFKIVHAIAHRKHYRNSMTKVGVVLPWFGGMCLVLFPGMGTTRIVNGRCLRLAVWPNEAMGMVSMRLYFFLFHDLKKSTPWAEGAKLFLSVTS